MILVSANPSNPLHFTGRKAKPATGRKAHKKGASPMAKKHRSAAQRAATRKLVAMNKAKRHRNPSSRPKKATKRRTTTHHNPYHAPKKRRTHRNPSLFGGGGILGELISKDGLMMVAGAFAAPMVTDYVQEKIMPSATGWTKVAVKAGLVLAGAFAIDKFLKMRKVALAYGVTGAAVVASDAAQIARGVMAGLSASEADMLASRPELVGQVASGSLGAPYSAGLGSPYATGLGVNYGAYQEYAPIQNLNPNNGMVSAFSPAFNRQF
jgi:hypothetical protein